MWFHSLFDAVKTRISRTPARRSPRPRPACRLRLEALEDRCLPSFSAPVIYAAGTNPHAVATADFNGDGRLDLAVLTEPHGVSTLLGNGDGTFRPTQHFSTGQAPLSLAVADFNGDGNVDLVTANNYDVGVLFGNGDGTFRDGPLFVSPSDTYPLAVAAGDVNGDNNPDLVVTSYQVFVYGDDESGYFFDYMGSVDVLLGDGAGGFPHEESYLDGDYPDHVMLADFNADGKLDIAADGVLLGNGDGTFQAAKYSVGGFGYAAGDFNRDGRLDLAGTSWSPTVSVQLGNGDGTFQAAQEFDTGEIAAWVAVADFDRDGRLDLVTANPGEFDSGLGQYLGDTVRVLLGDGFGGFGPALIYPAGIAPRFVAAADFNADGYPDLAADGWSSTVVSVLLNDGIWTAQPPLLPAISISDATITEGNSGTRAATFTVSLSSASSQVVTVAYPTADGTATAGSDYYAASGTVTFAPGVTRQTITVLVNGDRLAEPAETFVVNLSDATNATIADLQGVGTILDDEPGISIGDMTKQEGKKGQTTLFVFTVTLSVAYDEPVTVSFHTVDGTARAREGYVAKSGTLTFAPGETTKTITIEVKGDSKRELGETFYLDLFGNSSNSLFTNSRGTGWIMNDD